MGLGLLSTGLASITFRKSMPLDIVRIAARAGLSAIEWGGDVHVPHAELLIARDVARMTADHGLNVAAYGSYYLVGQDDKLPFGKVLETAIELGAPMIRVWAGNLGSAAASDQCLAAIVADSRRIGDLAASAGLIVSYEFHSGTIADNADSCLRLLQNVNHGSVKTYWQPPIGMATELCVQGLEQLLPWLTNVHVFHWGQSPEIRYALAQGVDLWKRYISSITSTAHKHCLLIEHVEGDSAEAFCRDAATLNDWIHASPAC